MLVFFFSCFLRLKRVTSRVMFPMGKLDIFLYLIIFVLERLHVYAIVLPSVSSQDGCRFFLIHSFRSNEAKHKKKKVFSSMTWLLFIKYEHLLKTGRCTSAVRPLRRDVQYALREISLIFTIRDQLVTAGVAQHGQKKTKDTLTWAKVHQSTSWSVPIVWHCSPFNGKKKSFHALQEVWRKKWASLASVLHEEKDSL